MIAVMSFMYALESYSLDGIFFWLYIVGMKWEVEYTDEFESWWLTLSESEQEDIAASVYLLEERSTPWFST